MEMHCRKMHDDMLHEHLSQLEPINQPMIDHSINQPTIQTIQPIIKQVTE
jgi:hypothetical protein